MAVRAESVGREPSPSSRELTARALIAGCGIGALLAALNVYAGLKIGYSDAGNLTAAILAFGLFELLGPLLSSRLGPLENNIAVTAAASAAAMGGCVGVVGPIAAMTLLGRPPPPWWGLVLWGMSLALFGIVIAALLRRSLMIGDPLPFPTGKATAELITVMDSARREGLARARALSCAALTAFLFTAFRDGPPEWIPGALFLPLAIAQVPARALGLGIAWSPMMAGTGALIGGRNAVGLLIGALVAWVGVAPLLVSSREASAQFSSLVSWLMWPGVALIVTSALAELGLGWRTLRGAVQDLARAGSPRGAPWRSGAAFGVAVSIALLAWLLFEVSPFHTLIAISLAVVLVAACVRAAGETDQAPTGAMGGLTQIALGLTGGPGPIATLVGGGITSGAATQASHMMWSLKAGRLLGASFGRQLTAQLAGALVGAIAVVPVYALIVRGYGLGTALMPASAPLSWKATAELVSRGAGAMPESAALAAASAAVVALVLVVLQRTRIRPFVPSPVAAGVAFLMPADYTATIVLGALAAAALRRGYRAWSEGHLAAVAAGGIAGESLAGLAICALRVFGVW